MNFSNGTDWMIVPFFLLEHLLLSGSIIGIHLWSKTVYPKPEGLMDPFYLAHLFQTIERNIIRIALTRSQPGFKKTAGEAVTKLIVGNLQANQWAIQKTQTKYVE